MDDLLRAVPTKRRTERKMRLLAAALGRAAFFGPAPAVLDLVERLADGAATDAERTAAHQRLWSQPSSADGFLSLALLNWSGVEAAFQILRGLGFAPFAADRREPVSLPPGRAATLLLDILPPTAPAPLVPTWRTSAAVALADAMYRSRDFGPMPVLADALEDAGCADPDILAHCRADGPHVRGCWVVDLVLGKS